MYIRCWGSRGSVPVSGKEYVKYGGDTTCIEIRSQDDEIIIIDSGTGIRPLGNRLILEKRNEFHLIFTHTHWDHIMGFPFFKPFYSPKSKFKMYRVPDSRFVKTMLSKMMTPPFFPVDFNDSPADIKFINNSGSPPDFKSDLKSDLKSEHFKIGTIDIDAIALSHPNTGRGYKFTENGKTFVFITDNELRYKHPGGLGFEDYSKFCKDADLLIHDGEYTVEEYKELVTWGHSSYIDALELALDAGVKSLGLFHINQDRTDDQVDEMVEDCHKILKEKQSLLKCFAVARGMTFNL